MVNESPSRLLSGQGQNDHHFLFGLKALGRSFVNLRFVFSVVCYSCKLVSVAVALFFFEIDLLGKDFEYPILPLVTTEIAALLSDLCQG